MRIQSTEIVETFAEAFRMWGARVIVTAENAKWALTAANSMTGFATSVIGCKCEAAIEREIAASETLDKRPGVSVLLFSTSAESLGKRLVERIGQCVMTCPTTACYNGLDSQETVLVGGLIRYFGDGYQSSKVLNGRRFWRIPVMDGEFLLDDCFGVQAAVGGGNLLLLGKNTSATLRAAEAAVTAMKAVPNVILPFPGGVVRSGSKPGSRYKKLLASTNDVYCPTLKAVVPQTQVSVGVNCVLEIVIDGLDLYSVEKAMIVGALAAAKENILQISAGNYGGNLGQYKIDLYKILSGQGKP